MSPEIVNSLFEFTNKNYDFRNAGIPENLDSGRFYSEHLNAWTLDAWTLHRCCSEFSPHKERKESILFFIDPESFIQ